VLQKSPAYRGGTARKKAGTNVKNVRRRGGATLESTGDDTGADCLGSKKKVKEASKTRRPDLLLLTVSGTGRTLGKKRGKGESS